jgi:hypothetical protein
VIGDTEHILSDIVYAPNIEDNFISLARLLCEGCTAVFGNFDGRLMGKIYHNDEVLFKAVLTNENMFDIDQRINGKLNSLKTKDKTWQFCHQTLGHINYNTMFHMNKLLDLGDLGSMPADLNCNECLQAKMHRNPFLSTNIKTIEPFQLVHPDSSGAIIINNCLNAKYYVLFIDIFTRSMFVYFFNDKTDETMVNIFEEFLSTVKLKYQSTVKQLKTGNGIEYLNNRVQTVLCSYNVDNITTIPHCPESNGTSEQNNLTIAESAKSLLLDARLSQYYWPHAVSTFVKLKNVVPYTTLGGVLKTRHQAIDSIYQAISRRIDS